MPDPTIEAVEPNVGPAGGGDLVRLWGRGFADRVAVWFGGVDAEVLGVHEDGETSLVDVRTPPHEPGRVDVELVHLDASGAAVPDEAASLPAAYRFQRPRLATESDLTRLVRTLLRRLKRDLAVNTSMRVSVDYADERHVDGMRVVPMATLPAIVLTPQRLPPNPMYGTRELRERVVMGPGGPEVVRHRPSLTVDAVFRLTGASDRVVELLNLLDAVGKFLNRTKWLEMDRDPERPEGGRVRWEMDAVGDFRTSLDGPDELAAFTIDVVVRGFDLDGGQRLDAGRRAAEVEVASGSLEP
ncbi:MAG TPA: transcription factor [Myxococcales bacterium]|nr:transcription factor [Myxococcales bacterium]